MRIKVGVIGTHSAGKSCIIQSFCDCSPASLKCVQLLHNNKDLVTVKFAEYNDSKHASWEHDLKEKTSKDKNINDLFSEKRKIIETCQCFIVVFDVTNSFSFDLVPHLIDNIYDIHSDKPPYSLPIVLMANKIDLTNEFDTQELLKMRQYAKSYSYPFYETCTISNTQNFQEKFQNIHKAIMYLINETIGDMLSNENDAILYESDSDIEKEDTLNSQTDFESICPFCCNVILKGIFCCYCCRKIPKKQSNRYGDGMIADDDEKQLELAPMRSSIKHIGNYERVDKLEKHDFLFKIVFIGQLCFKLYFQFTFLPHACILCFGIFHSVFLFFFLFAQG